MSYILLAVSAVVILTGCTMYFRTRRKIVADTGETLKHPNRSIIISIIIAVIGIWLLIGSIMKLIFGSSSQEKFTVSVIPPRVDFTIFNYQPSETMIVGWGVMAVLIITAVVLRIFFIPRLSDNPGKFQNVIETIVEAVENYASEKILDLGRPIYGYIFAIGLSLIGNAIAELLGFRSPSSDLMFTIALSLFAFFMANWYGIQKLSLKGRLKNLMSPSPLLLPIRIVTDLANPFSMACRLFGNTISGMIIMNLIYSVLGNFDAFIPSVVGLYFNVFTALIQMIIFITLTLSNINQATTKPES